jgi:FAD:protein FMN transferase
MRDRIPSLRLQRRLTHAGISCLVPLDRLLSLGFERARTPQFAQESLQIDGTTILVTRSRPAMGTLVSISALGGSPARLEDAIGAAFVEMDRLIDIFSRFEPDSALTVLNDTGRLVGPPPELAYVVEGALRYHALTQGSFDISVAPLLMLAPNPLAPGAATDAAVAAALALVGAGHISAGKRVIRFKRNGMSITLDGIAKGYIVDCLARTLIQHRVCAFLINAGGDIRTAGVREHGRPWTVGVWDPGAPGVFPDVIHMTDGAVATSGQYARGGHIVDGSTGRSPDHHMSVSIRAPTTMAADALATALFVLDAPRGLALIESLAHCECLILDANGRHFRSSGWRKEP